MIMIKLNVCSAAIPAPCQTTYGFKVSTFSTARCGTISGLLVQRLENLINESVFMEYLPRMPLRMLPDRFRLYFRIWEYELCC